jgi:phosphoglycerate kinase
LDVIVSTNPKGEFYTRITGPGLIRKEESIFDIGPETINIYSRIIKEAKMIVWAGPLGLFEEKKFEKGTKEIARAVSLNHQAFKIVGGGDTGVALTKFGFRKSIDHISTGGGAMLDFFSDRKLPGLKALGYYD